MTFVATLLVAMVLMRIAVPAGASAARFGPEGSERGVESALVRAGPDGPELALQAALAAGRPFCYAGRQR
jgi:hypothetical protein